MGVTDVTDKAVSFWSSPAWLALLLTLVSGAGSMLATLADNVLRLGQKDYQLQQVVVVASKLVDQYAEHDARQKEHDAALRRELDQITARILMLENPGNGRQHGP
jgi:hypothetical protein